MSSRKPVLVITHWPGTDTWRVEAALRERGLPTLPVLPHRGDALPPLDTLAAVVSMGGPMSAADADTDPVLGAERDYLRSALDASVPVLGICMGAQLLGVAAGGSAHVGERGLEAGYITVWPEPEAPDPVLGARTQEYFSFHSDTVDLPSGTLVLARSDRYVQAFRVGAGLGIQFHPELTLAGIERLLQVETDKIRSAGVDPDLMLARARVVENEGTSPGGRLLARWTDELVAQDARPDPADERSGR